MLMTNRSKWTVLPAVAALVLGAGVLLAADDEGAKPKAPTTAPTTQQAAANKFCDVMGEGHEVDPKVTVQHKGQTIAFCCAECIDEFKKNPDKYLAKMK